MRRRVATAGCLRAGRAMTPAERGALTEGARALGVELDVETISRIGVFLETFAVWNRRTRLTGERDLEVVIARHVVDSLALLPDLSGAGPVLEIGSGGGFPGIVLACARPDLDILLVESRRRKVSFLRAALRAIALPHARALEMRAEEAAKDRTIAGRMHAVIGRGLRLETLLALAGPLLSESGEAIAMQTPRTSEGVPARLLGLELVRRRTYRLHRYGPRTLLFFARRPVS